MGTVIHGSNVDDSSLFIRYMVEQDRQRQFYRFSCLIE